MSTKPAKKRPAILADRPTFPIKLHSQPARTLVIWELERVGRIRLSLTPKAFAAARLAIERGDPAAALRLALGAAGQ